ncbi:unnamed protein product [Rhodiola kirilowii]
MAFSASISLLFFSTFIIIFSLTLHINCAPSQPAEIQVGGKDGWHVPDNNDTSFYTRWAADNRFHVGDSLSFVYRNDSVMVVDKYAYYHCNTTKPIYIFRDQGKTVIKLDRPGPFYFISGAPDHCKNGQRLEVDVMSNSPPRPIVFPPDDYAHAPAPSSASSCLIESSLRPLMVLVFAAGLASFGSHC